MRKWENEITGPDCHRCPGFTQAETLFSHSVLQMLTLKVSDVDNLYTEDLLESCYLWNTVFSHAQAPMHALCQGTILR